MKKFIIIIAAILLGFSSCKDTDLMSKSPFYDSYDAWVFFKKGCGNSYFYVAAMPLEGEEIFEKTLIVVDKGRVIERAFYRRGKDSIDAEGKRYPTFEEEWREDASNLGKYLNEGAEVRTLDEIYEIAEKEWLPQRIKTEFFFVAGNQGMISLCGYVERNCTQNCHRGVRIEQIGKLDELNKEDKDDKKKDEEKEDKE